MLDKISFEDYDRITDTVMYLSDGVVLSFVTVLSRKAKDGSRSFFHFETLYGSKYIGQSNSRAIKRQMNYYFCIENKKDFGSGFIMRPQDVYIILNLIENNLFPYYFDKEKRIYEIKEKKLFITGEFTPVFYPQSEYRSIRFDPTIVQYPDNTYKEGVTITLHGSLSFVMDIDKFIGFYYTIKNTDMYALASTMASYVKIPPYGVNVYSCLGLGGGEPLPEDWQSNEISPMKNETGKSKSFLDNLNDKRKDE